MKNINVTNKYIKIILKVDVTHHVKIERQEKKSELNLTHNLNFIDAISLFNYLIN